MSKPATHFVDGAWLASGPLRKTVDVYTGADFGQWHEGDEAIAELAISAARICFERSEWAHAPRQRAAALFELVDAIEARVEEISQAIAVENGKVIAHCRHETNAAISEARYYAGLARSIFGRVTEVGPGQQSILSAEPVGVASIVIPWNAPSTLLLRALGPAMAAGCTSVVKGAAQVSTVNRIYAECLASCPSIPPGAVNMVHGDIEVSRMLCTHPEVDVVSFTGSSATGKAIMAGAAPTLKRLSLELGGKAPALIFADADLDRAATEVSRGLIPHCGQMCTAIARILVADEAWDAFVPKLVTAVQNISVGDPLGDGIAMGPLFDEASVARYESNTSQAESVGETLVASGVEAGHPQRNVVRPCLYHLDDPAHRLNQQELFAPIGMLARFGSEEEAVLSGNATRFGLAASVFTSDHERARRMSRALKSGTVWINCHNRLFAEAETGGYRESGMGRLHGLEGLADFMETKHIYSEYGRLNSG